MPASMVRAVSVASTPGTGGGVAVAPVAMTSSSNGSSRSVRALRSCTVRVRAARSMAVTSWRMRTSMPLARCWSGERATRSSASDTRPAT